MAHRVTLRFPDAPLARPQQFFPEEASPAAAGGCASRRAWPASRDGSSLNRGNRARPERGPEVAGGCLTGGRDGSSRVRLLTSQQLVAGPVTHPEYIRPSDLPRKLPPVHATTVPFKEPLAQGPSLCGRASAFAKSLLPLGVIAVALRDSLNCWLPRSLNATLAITGWMAACAGRQTQTPQIVILVHPHLYHLTKQ